MEKLGFRGKGVVALSALVAAISVVGCAQHDQSPTVTTTTTPSTSSSTTTAPPDQSAGASASTQPPVAEHKTHHIHISKRGHREMRHADTASEPSQTTDNTASPTVHNVSSITEDKPEHRSHSHLAMKSKIIRAEPDTDSTGGSNSIDSGGNSANTDKTKSNNSPSNTDSNTGNGSNTTMPNSNAGASPVTSR